MSYNSMIKGSVLVNDVFSKKMMLSFGLTLNKRNRNNKHTSNPRKVVCRSFVTPQVGAFAQK